jgi:thiol-disulfide isomerase/thioredoxin
MVVLASGLLGAAALATACRHDLGPAIAVGQPAPAFELASLDGGRLASESLAGELVVLNFWATWCGPCRREIPALKQLDEDPEVRVVGINLDLGATREVSSFVARNQIGYTVLMGDEEVAEQYRVGAIPTTVVLDRAQRVVSVYRGLVSRRTLEAALERARKAEA